MIMIIIIIIIRTMINTKTRKDEAKRCEEEKD